MVFYQSLIIFFMNNKIKKGLIAATGALLVASFALPAFAQTSAGTPTASAPKMDLACVQNAVDVREGAIGDAFSSFTTSENTALSARKSALHDAWGMTDGKSRRAARDKAWSDYHIANKAAFAALRTAKKSAWSAFETASKACKVPVVEASAMEGTGSLGL